MEIISTADEITHSEGIEEFNQRHEEGFRLCDIRLALLWRRL